MTVDPSFGSIDDEELRARAVQGMGERIPIPPAQVAAPIGNSPISSIAPTHVLFDVINCYAETERLANKGAKLFEAETRQNLEEIDQLNTERQEALEKEAKAAQSRGTWQVLHTVAQYIAGATAIVLGGAAFSLSPVAGSLLIASGVCGFANRVLHDTPLLESIVTWLAKSEELQLQYSRKIEMGLFLLEMGLGIAGGVMAWKAGAFRAAQGAGVTGAIKKVSSIIGAASGITTATSQLGMTLYDKKIADLRGRLKEIEGQTTASNQTLSQETFQVRRVIESTEEEAAEIRKAIQTLHLSID